MFLILKKNIDVIIKRIEDDNLECTLRKYQNYPTEFIKENRKSSLLLDMGLDKTVIGLMAIKDLFFDSLAEYSGAAEPLFRKSGNRLSGIGNRRVA